MLLYFDDILLEIGLVGCLLPDVQCSTITICTATTCTSLFLIHLPPHTFQISHTTLQYANKEFGACPLIQCYGQPVLPVGLKDDMGADTVKIFCPKCHNVYHPPPMRYRNSNGGASSAAVDGAAFGTTFAHLFLMTFNNLAPDGLSQESAYVPRVFGFRVHPTARSRAGNGTGISPTVAAVANATATAGNRRNAIVATETVNGGAIEVEAEAVVPQQQESAKMDTPPIKPAAAVAGGEDNDNDLNQSQSKGKKAKGKKTKSEDSAGSLKRRGKNGDTADSSTSKRQKLP